MASNYSNSGSGGSRTSSTGAASQAPSASRGAGAAAPAPAAPAPVSNYSIYKEFGGQHQFMASYGLKPGDPGAYAESRRIAEAMKAGDAEDARGARR